MALVLTCQQCCSCWCFVDSSYVLVRLFDRLRGCCSHPFFNTQLVALMDELLAGGSLSLVHYIPTGTQTLQVTACVSRGAQLMCSASRCWSSIRMRWNSLCGGVAFLNVCVFKAWCRTSSDKCLKIQHIYCNTYLIYVSMYLYYLPLQRKNKWHELWNWT